MEEKFYNLTNPQKNIWSMEQFYKGTNINNICGSLIIKQNTDLNLLNNAINLFIQNNKSFGLNFKEKNEELIQYFTTQEFEKFEIVALKNYKEVQNLAREITETTFDIKDKKLYKFTLFKLENGYGGFIVLTHHIISDAATFALMGTEIVENYINILENKEIKQKNYSYEDYINSEEEYINSNKYLKDEEYWNTIYSTVPEIACIPSNKKEQNIKLSEKANRKNYTIKKDLLDKIGDFCKQNKISNFNFFMAVYAIYLSRVSNLNDFVIGTPILNRTNYDEKHATGMFINTAPLRIKIENDIKFIDLVKNIAQSSLSMLRHQKYPYENILKNLRKIQKDLPTIFDIMLSYQITKANDRDIKLPYEVEWFPTSTIQNGMYIHLHDNNDENNLNISYDYQIQKYDEADIDNIHMRILHIINQVMENDNCLEKDIEIITPEEKNKIINKFNNTYIEYPHNKTIVDLFENQVEKTPNNIAVVCENEKLTFKELNEKANQLAFCLKNKGVKENSILGILLERSINMIVAILAVLKSGGAYIPIDPDYPKDRIEYMLMDSKCKLLLSTKKLYEKSKFNIEYIDLEDEKIYKNNTQNLNLKINQESLSYIIYTSGSTGKPKGVMLKHKGLSNLINYCNNYIKYLKDNKYRTIISVTTVSFDIFFFESIISLQKGLKLVIANQQQQTIPELLKELINKEKAEIIQTTPSRMKLLLDNIKNIEEISNLKYITLAGEQYPDTLAEALRKIKNVTLYNGYGPSETTIFSTLTDVTNVKKMTIGKPLDNTQIYILDSNMNLCPIGIPGELYISGSGVGNGYINNEKLTNASFLENKFNNNSLLYKTGDLGYFNNDGTITCLGRADNQVKIRGLRIELEEIEKAICSIPEIKDCVVAKKQNETGHEFLCAYYVENKNIENSKIRNILQKKLTNYMIPQYFVKMDKLPYTPNGKIDRKKLPEPQIKISKKEIIKPRNDTDSKLVQILKDLLNINSISIDDSFFELGGDSLYAINLSIKIKDKFNVQISSKDILENPIIQDLSDIISTKNNITENKTIKKIPEAEFYKISSAQKRIYFASQVAGNSSILYNVPGGIIIDGDIDSIKLEKCLNTLISRHESLRTFFEINGENVVQKIAKNIELKLEVENLANFEDLQKIFKNFIKPFDLTKAPLFRAKLLKFKNKKSVILVDMHHIISDGASLSILTDELSNLYNDKNLSDLSITYKDYAEFESEQFKTEFFEEAQNYWINQFNNEIPVLNLPTTYTRPAVQSFEGKKIYSTINFKTKQKIDTLAKSLDITPFMILLSAYYILLSKYTAQDDIIVGSPIVGRDTLETHNLIGMFVNTLALRNKIDINLSFKEFVLSIKENILNAYKYQTYPFDELVNKLDIKRDTSRNPLFDTMFIYQSNRYDTINFNGMNAEYYLLDSGISKFDLSLEALPNNDKIKLSFEYATKLFSEEFIQDLSNHYLNILNVILENENTKIEDICMLSKEEKNKILFEFNDTKTDYEKNKTISELFEEQVEKTPNNIAVVHENESLTFKELNEKSNSLANFLRNNGVTKNSLVGIMLNRSLEVIIAMLAVVKAGGAYIPIDPTYPKDRINYMLDSSHAEILLTKKHLENNIEFKNKISIDLKNSDVYKFSTENLKNINEPEDLIYCIFTSGSTGKPKGVMIPHRVISNFTNYCNNYVEYLKNPNYDAIVSITTISFDLFVYEALISLQKGLKLIISNENEQTTPQLLNNLIEKNNANILQSTPSIMQIFLNNLENMPALKKLKYVILAGEQLPLSLVQELHKLNIVVYNGYGPSETHYCTLAKMNDEIITIGKPISNSQMYILDKKFNPVPIGIAGDVYISGECVGKGYLNNKELTDKSFIKNPFLPNTMMYRSGDLGMYLSDGNILCLGRSDHQIKIRGLRIELEEIESLILKYPNIKKVTVVKQVIQNREFISAYFVANKRIATNELRKYLSRSLPRYMVPSYYTALEDLPYTPNGKIDKKALPLPKEILNTNAENYVAPKTKLQKQLVSIFEKILNTKPIGINDNFFELGGDSLLAMNLNVELQKISNKITYQDIFRFPTISELEEIMESNDKKSMFTKVQNLPESFIDILKNSRKYERIKTYHPKNILLTGSTGFLGIHILEELLKLKDTNIYCIIRDEPGVTSTTKLHQKLNFYFGNKYDDLINNRIFVITGNISKPGFGLNQEELLNLANSIDVIINSAANVAHYGNYNDFYNANVLSVKYIIDFCNNFKKKLYHISTIGVAGRTLDSSYPKCLKKTKVTFDESDLYIGQDPENIYTFTKFKAEVQILNAINDGLDAYILRMGNLMPRYRDGVFQENVADNAFMNRLASFVRIGMVPEYMLHNKLEITPVDYAAKSVCKLLTHKTNKNRIFHLCNTKTVSVIKCLNVLKKLNYNIEFLPEKDFIARINEILESEDAKNLLNIIIDDFDENMHINYNTDMILKSKFTAKYLRKTIFYWPKINNRYLIKFVNVLRRIL